MANDEKKSLINEKKKTNVKNEKGLKNILNVIFRMVVFIALVYPLFPLITEIKKERAENELLWKAIVQVYNEQNLRLPINEEVPVNNDLPVDNISPDSEDVNKVQEEEKETKIKGNKKYRKFRQSEIEDYFTVDLIHSIEPENYFMKRALKNYDINDDEKMKEHPEEYKINTMVYEKYIEQDYSKDDRFYIQLIDQHKGFGLFAFKKIKQNDVIGVYTGLISMELGKKIFDTKYLFYITSMKHPYTGAKADLYIDARVAGNQLRFVNHDSDPNCEAIYVPYKGMWNVVFVAKRDIDVDEEITINYGKSFRSVRGKELENKEEESGPDDYMDTEWDIKRKEEMEARDPKTGKKLHYNIPNRYELEDQKKKIIQRMKNRGVF